MQRIKVIVQEEQHKLEPHPAGGEKYSNETYWETIDDMTSTDKTVIAGALRAIANKYDPPPKVNYRGTD